MPGAKASERWTYGRDTFQVTIRPRPSEGLSYTFGMRLSPARQAAFGALMGVERGGWSAETVAAKTAHLDGRDAGLAAEIAFGVLRRQGELDAAIAAFANRPATRLDAAVRIALEMGLYQLGFLDRVPAHAVVNDSVQLARRAGKASAGALVNAILRRAARESAATDQGLSTPAWLLERWKAHYGGELAAGIVRASLERPRRYIRVPWGAMPPEGAAPTDVPGCYILETGILNSGEAGAFRFQDIGSQAVVPLLDLRPGETFLDICAAPGNKTAQALESGARAVACDLHLSRAKTLLPLGIPVAVIDARGGVPFSRKFDRVLVDAPCSGTGTLGRNPEIKWRLQEADIGDLQNRQIAILRNALGAVAPGGLLVYSTCSLERAENEDVIAASGAVVERTMQRIPGRDAGDGFFAAVLRP
jgi:16S rRNA (cytosine967-C5)-methyltransferase